MGYILDLEDKIKKRENIITVILWAVLCFVTIYLDEDPGFELVLYCLWGYLLIAGIFTAVISKFGLLMSEREKQLQNEEYAKESVEFESMEAFEEGLLEYEKKNYKVAKLLFDKSIACGYEPKGIYFHRGFCLHEIGAYKAAILDFDNEILIQPEDCNIFYMRSFPKIKLGDFDGSRRDIKDAIRLSKVESELNKGYILKAKDIGGWESHTHLYISHLEMHRNDEKLYKRLNKGSE